MDIHQALASNYVLIDLTTNSWSAEKTDKSASRRAEQHEGAAEGAVKLVKNLLVENNADHKAARSAQTAVRTYVYAISVPWTTSGGVKQKKGERMILTSQLMDIMPQVDALIHASEVAKKEFISKYTQARDNALVALGNMASLSDYPTPEELEERFSVTVKYKPIPQLSDYSRLSIPAELAEGMAKAQAEENATAMKIAQDDATSRLLKQLDRMTEQLTKVVKGEKTKIYETLVTNMREVASVVETTNFDGNPVIAQAIEDIRTKLVPKYRDKDDFKEESLARKTLDDVREIRGVITAQGTVANVVGSAAAAELSAYMNVQAEIEEVDLGGINFDESTW